MFRHGLECIMQFRILQVLAMAQSANFFSIFAAEEKNKSKKQVFQCQ